MWRAMSNDAEVKKKKIALSLYPRAKMKPSTLWISFIHLELFPLQIYIIIQVVHLWDLI